MEIVASTHEIRDKRYIIIGFENVDGVEAVPMVGRWVLRRQVTPGIAVKAQEVLEEHLEVRDFMFECTDIHRRCASDYRFVCV